MVRRRVLLFVAILFSLTGLGCAMMQAGGAPETKALVGVSVPDTLQAAETVFEELGIRKAATGMSPVTAIFGLTVGKAASGTRVQVIANRRGDQTEIVITTDSPEDPQLEASLLSAIQTHLHYEETRG